MPDELDTIAIEICHKDFIDNPNALADSAVAMIAAHKRHPNAQLIFLIGGYDDDPRSLWHIPEAARFIRLFAEITNMYDWQSSIFKQLDQEMIAILALCDAIKKPHPFLPIIRPDVPQHE